MLQRPLPDDARVGVGRDGKKDEGKVRRSEGRLPNPKRSFVAAARPAEIGRSWPRAEGQVLEEMPQKAVILFVGRKQRLGCSRYSLS
jgi:hypothetical protein